MGDLNLTTTCDPHTQGWFVLGVISTRHRVDADFHIFHARIVKARGDELLCRFAGGKVAHAVLRPLKFLGGCEGPGAELLQELHARTIAKIKGIATNTYANKCANKVRFLANLRLCVLGEWTGAIRGQCGPRVELPMHW